MGERLIRLPEVVTKLGIARSTVWQYCKDGKLPKPLKISPKITVWRESDIDSYIAQLQKAK